MSDASTMGAESLAESWRDLRAQLVSIGRGVGWVGGFITACYVLGNLLSGLVALGLVLVSRRLFAFARWARARRKALLAASLPVPSVRALWRIWRAERKRLRALVDQWPTRCLENGLKLAGRAPVLVDHQLDLSGDTATARMIRTGFDPDDVTAKARKLAKGLGLHSITVRETSPGCADLKFNWTDPLRREVRLSDLQLPKHGGVVPGVTEHGEPAELRLDASKSFVGASGSGKSNAAEAALASLVARGEHIRVYVSNPKKTELRKFKQFEKQARGRFEVRQYAETDAENKTMIKNFRNAMNVRNDHLKDRKITRTSRENPLSILWLDEMMMLPKDVYKEGPYSDLGQCCLAGRASLFVVWGSTQMFYASDFGTVRNLFDERLLFRVKTKTQADTVIDGATDRGANPHKLRARVDAGIGWIEQEESSNELVKFRAAHVTDADLDRIIRGQVPEGMRTEPDPEPAPVETGRERLSRWARCALVMARRAVKAILAPIRRRARGVVPALLRVVITVSFALAYRRRAVRIASTVPLAQLRAYLGRKARALVISGAVFAQLVIGMAR